MSYILDALRRADAERERGGVPGLHAQPFPPGSADAAAARRGVPWRWIGVGAACGLAVPLALWLLGGDEAPRPAPLPQAIAPAPETSPPPAAAAEPAAPRVEPAPLTSAAAPPVTAPAPSPAPPPATPRRAAAPAPEAGTTRKPAPPATAATKPTARPATEPAPQAAARITPIGELPEPIRRQLPPLQIGGSMYSAEPANRMLIVNGQLLQERAAVAPGLVLEQIRLKSAVFDFQGQRFEITY